MNKDIIISKDVANIYLILAINYKNRIDYLERENKIHPNKLIGIKRNIQIVDKGVEQISEQL